MTYWLGARDEGPEGDTQQEWREPPGYLGEAVRRAKRIPHGTTPSAPGPH